MKLKDKHIQAYIAEAAEYADRDAFASDVALSAADPEEEISAADIEQIARMWDVAVLPFRDLLSAIGMTQTKCSTRFCIPLRTVQHWCGKGDDARECALHVRLMIAELTGYLNIREI